MAPGMKTSHVDFQSWANTLQASAAPVLYPTSDEELQAIVAHCREQPDVFVRPLGNSHSLSPCVRGSHSGAIMLSMEKYRHASLADCLIDQEEATATAVADMRLYEINRRALEHGLMLKTLPGIGDFSIAGFVSTSTHGSFFDSGLFSNCVLALRVVFADGLIEWVDKHDAVFRYLLGGMGLFGIITHVKIQLRDASGFSSQLTPFHIPVKHLSALCERILRPAFNDKNSGLTLVYDMSGRGFLAQLNTQTSAQKPPAAGHMVSDSFRLLGPKREAMFSHITRLMRGAFWQKSLRHVFAFFTVSVLQQMSTKARQHGGFWATTNTFTEVSRCMFLGYFVPMRDASDIKPLLALIDDTMRACGLYTELPLEIRFVKACDSQVLSPIPPYEAPGAGTFNNMYMAVDIPVFCGGLDLAAMDRPDTPRSAHTQRVLNLFMQIERAIKAQYPQARPHWAKLNSLQTDGNRYWAWDSATLRAMVPAQSRAAFAQMLQHHDPHGCFRGEPLPAFLEAFV